MTLEEAKTFCEGGLFSAGNAGGSALYEKLSHLLRLKSKDNGANEMKGDFEKYLSDGLIQVCDVYSSANNYDNIGCDEKGWSWSQITGPIDVSEFMYAEVFDKDALFFVLVYQLYLGVFEGKSSEQARSRADMVFKATSADELREQVVDTADALYDIASIVEDLVFEVKNKGQDVEENDERKGGLHEGLSDEVISRYAMEALVLAAYYLFLYITDQAMDEKYMDRLEAVMSNLFAGEDAGDAEEYLQYFIEEVASSNPGSIEAEHRVLPLLLDVFFSMRANAYGMTPCLYIFTSAPMKRYKDLREKNPEHELIPYLDKLIKMLENPACMEEYSVDSDGYLVEDDCYMECSYTSEEYVCAYWFYPRAYGQYTGGVRFDYLYSLARKVFSVLFEAFEKSVLRVE